MYCYFNKIIKFFFIDYYYLNNRGIFLSHFVSDLDVLNNIYLRTKEIFTIIN